MYAFAIRNCLAFVLLSVAFAEIPSYIKVCRRDDPEINKCVVDSINQLRDKLAEGIPELDVPSIEPLVIKQVHLLRGPKSAKLDINITNIEVYGLKTMQIRNLKADAENMVFTFKIFFKKLDFRGKYQMDAQLLLLKLNGDGGINGTFLNYEFDSFMKANKVIRDNNKTYVKFEKIKYNIKIGKTRINFDNLFNGDPVLGPASNDLLNSNSNLLMEELKPALEDALSEVFTEVANKITKDFTYDELFPLN